MDSRLQFVAEATRTDEPFVALCARHGIAPKTGYKWLARYAAEGPAGLHERSRRPRTSPTATAPAAADALLELRRRHPTWGAKKLLAVLGRRHPRLTLPAPSTAAALLQRAGLVTARRRRRALGHPGRPTAAMDAPNAVWTADFKGEFKTRDGVYCYPLTVADGYSRFLLACRGLPSTATAGARPVFERLFREYGLPARIRSDNGVPFATIALARLSALSVWWVRLGILPDLTEPSSPQQNGRHERLHRTLEAEACRPPQAHARAQQRAFDDFRREYNAERPHEALGQATPASRYAASHGRTRGGYRRSSTRPTGRCAASAATAACGGTTSGSTSATSSPRSTWPSRRSPTACGRCTLGRCGSGASTSRCSRSSTSTTAPPAATRAACYRCPWTDPLPMSPDRTHPRPNESLQLTEARLAPRASRDHVRASAAELGR
jgi:transposase InsO family protein